MKHTARLLSVLLLTISFNIYAADPWADAVVSFTQGTGASSSYANSQVVLGAPASSSTLTAGAFSNTELLSLGLGGTLVVGFDEPIYNQALNPFGIDFLIFGNSFFSLSAGKIAGVFTEPTQTIWVSQDNNTYYQLKTTRGADDLFPTQGTGDPTLPVDPSLSLADFTGKSTANALSLYAGSAGGTPFDLEWACDAEGNSVSLPWVSYIKVVNTSSTVTGEIDAFATVAAVPEPSSMALGLAGAVGLIALRRGRARLRPS